MLVDLGRNDIGKISELGSVKVEKYLTVERYSCVHDLGSTVTGTIKKGKDAIDAVDAILPAGTLSGHRNSVPARSFRNWNKAREAFTAVQSDMWISQEIWMCALQSVWYIRKR